MTRRLARLWLPAIVCACGWLGLIGCESAGPADDPAATEAALKQFADFFHGASAYQVRSRIELVVTDADGQRHPDLSPPAEERTIAVARPDRFAVTSNLGTGIVSDGSSVAAWSTQRGKYWRGRVPFSLSELMSSRVGTFFQSPLNAYPLLWAGMDPTTTLTLALGTPSYVGRETLGGRQAHHLRLPGEAERRSNLTRSPTLDIWIAAEGDPVPLQAIYAEVPSLTRAKNGAAFTATVSRVETFRDWSFEVPDADQFAFHRPDGVRRVFELEDVPVEDHPLVGRPAPELDLPLVNEGGLRLADHVGKDVVILDFWATWCQPCLMELPIMSKVANDYRDRSVILYAVNQGQMQAEVERYLAVSKLPVTVALDPMRTVEPVYGSESIPHLVLIGKEGKVQAVHSGFGPGLEERVRQELDLLVDGVDLATDGLPEQSVE